MHIAIEARALSNKGSGIRTYTKELIRNLLELDSENTYSLLLDNKSSQGAFNKVREYVVPLHYPLFLSRWLNTQIPVQLQNIHPDIVHFTKAAVPARKELPTVVTIYDVIPLLYPASQSWLRRQYWPRTLHAAASSADHILTISEASKRDISRLLQVSEDKITVTPLAVDHTHFRPVKDNAILDSVTKKYNITQPYIFFLGTRDPRKNVASLIRSFDKIKNSVPHQLVIAGKKGNVSDHAESIIDALHLGNRVRLLDFVDYTDLPALYSEASLFVWPSIYEGWGFPVQEAMACGTPVIVSNGGALPEVVGNAGIIVPFSTEAVPNRVHDRDFEMRLSSAIENTLRNSATCDAMKAAGLAQAAKFNWQAVAKRTLEVYKKVCSK